MRFLILSFIIILFLSCERPEYNIVKQKLKITKIEKKKFWNPSLQYYEFKKIGTLNDSISINLNSYQIEGDSVLFYYYIKK
jgi:hypothetical protein